MSATITEPQAGASEPGTFLNPRRSRRGVSFALALVIEVLLLLILLTPRFREAVIHPTRVLKTFDFKLPRAGGAPKAASAGKVQHSAQKVPPPPLPPPPVPLPKPPPDPLAMSAADYAATDISKLGGGKGGSSRGKGNAYGPPDGPGSELFQADWYRKPSRGELAAYFNANTPTGWGMIACKTAERYHVEDCHALGESPVGSGIARALRLAAWQFLVIPPRENNKPLIGVWVRIRFELLPPGKDADDN